MTAPEAREHLDVPGIDALIALTYADITWHNPAFALRAWDAIDDLLDRRNRLTQAHRRTHSGTHQ